MERYFMKVNREDLETYNVYDRTRANMEGKPWCVAYAKLWSEVWPVLNQLNREDRESRQDVVSWWAN